MNILYEKLYELQEEYNTHTNITRINSKDEYYLKHIQDSLELAKILPKNVSLIDVGTGAGYPGFPIAIERQDIEVTLNDSVLKKIKYLEQTKDKLELNNIKILPGRAEEIGQKAEYRQHFFAATARALAQISCLLELLSPLVVVSGKLYLMKGPDPEDEIKEADNAAKILGLEIAEIKKYSLEDNQRTIIIYNKIKDTPEQYPRRPGIPEKKPL